MIAIVTVIMTILQVFIDSGLGNALIQKTDSDDLDFSSVFFFNIFVCLLLYGVLFASSAKIAAYYDIPELTLIIRVLGLSLIVSGVKNIQQAYVAKRMIFRKFFFATLIGTVLAGVVGIYMALAGYGVWALVAQSLINISVDTLVLWGVVGWRPKWLFSFSRLRGLLSFGWKLLVARLLTAISANVRQLIVGKSFSTEDLAYYNRGSEFPAKTIPLISTSIDDVLFPSLSIKQNNSEELITMLRKANKVVSYIVFPILMGMALCGKTAISLLLSDKWLPAYPFLCIFCCEYAVSPLSSINNNAFKAIGRSDITLKIQMIVRLLGIASLFIAIKYGVLAIAISSFLTAFVELLTVSLSGKIILSHKIRNQILDLCPAILLTLVMGIVLFFLGALPINKFVILVIQVVSGIVIYFVLSHLFQVESYVFLLKKIKNALRKKKEVYNDGDKSN